MLVQSAPGTRTPKEANPREYITDTCPVDFIDTAYYRRLLDDGSLVEVLVLGAGPMVEVKTAKKKTGGDQ
jgi:hypothetical protein